MVSLQLVDVGLVSNNDVLKLLELGHLVLQGASYFQGAAGNFLLGKHTQQGQLNFWTNLDNMMPA